MTRTLDRAEAKRVQPVTTRRHPAWRNGLFALVVVAAVVAVSVAVVMTDGESEASPELTAGQVAEAARLSELAASYEPNLLTRGQLADVARWSAMSRASAVAELRGDVALSREHVAVAARMTELAESLGFEPIYSNGLTRGQLATALRYQGLAEAAGR